MLFTAAAGSCGMVLSMEEDPAGRSASFLPWVDVHVEGGRTPWKEQTCMIYYCEGVQDLD